jgi:hypothetical protein
LLEDNTVVTNKTRSIIVGQRAYFKRRITPDTAPDSEKWEIGGTTVKSYTITAGSGQKENLQESDLDGNDVQFYWIAPGTGVEVKYTATINGTDYSAKTTYQVKRPPAGMTATHTTDMPAVAVGDEGDGKIALHFGSGVSPGMKFRGDANPPTGGTGEIGFIQLVNIDVRKTLDDDSRQKFTSGGLFVLDSDGTQVFYGATVAAPQNILSIQRMEDSPRSVFAAGTKHYSRIDYFRTYWMYKPNGGIWVTLRKCEWYWKGAATKGANGWALDPGSSDYTQNPASAVSTELPEWNNFFGNLQWVPE